jgi:DNA-binding response OmpR family regulator
VGKSISFADEILSKFMLIGSIPAVILSLIGALILDARIRSFITNYATEVKTMRREANKISFDKKTGNLTIDNHVIEIPYATHQYYLCKALFSAPRKRWEGDELLDLFGETDSTNRRKVYDAMLIVNKKAAAYMSDRLIVSRDRIYQINENLLPKIS